MKTIRLLLLFATASFISHAQNVVVAEDENANADGSSILDIQSSNKGVLLPRLTEAQRLVVLNPATGLLVYQTDQEDGFYFYNGASWLHLIDGVEEDPAFNASSAASITDQGSGVVISDGERSDLQNALVQGNGAIEIEDTVQINSVLLFPRMTISERNMLISPEEGSVIYQTDNTPGLRVYESNRWNLVAKKVAYISHLENAGGKGGSNISGTQTRELTDIEGDQDFFDGGLVSNQFTLEPGLYEIEASAPAHRVDRHQLRLYNVTEAEVASTSDGRDFYGTSAWAHSAISSGSRSTLSGRISIDFNTMFRLEHYTETVQASEGLGSSVNQATELYTTMKITKIAD